MLPTPPSEWDTLDTLYMASLLEITNEIRDGKYPKRNATQGHLFTLYDDEGNPLLNEYGEPIKVYDGDKSYQVSDEDFEAEWAKLVKAKEAERNGQN